MRINHVQNIWGEKIGCIKDGKELGISKERKADWHGWSSVERSNDSRESHKLSG